MLKGAPVLAFPLLISALVKTSGAEVTPGTIETARKQNPTVNYRLYDGKSIPFDDATFDLVFAICVVHHIPLEETAFFY